MSKSIIESINRLVKRVPGRYWLAVGSLLAAAFWMHQHDARIRQQARLEQVRNETSTQVAVLRKQAAQDVKRANVENAKAIEKLEQRRRALEQQNRQLAAQLDRLRGQAQIQAGEAATLPISEIVTRVAAQLGLKAEDLAGKEKAASRQGAKAQRKLQVTNYELQKPSAKSVPPTRETTPHPAAGASALSPGRGHGRGPSADITKSATSASPVVVLPLTSSGARKVEKALVELGACRAESGIQTRQISNCQARAATDEAEVGRLKGSVDSLNHALAAKDRILERRASEYKAELRAARGTFLGRVVRVTEHVAIGVAVGVAIGVAAK